MTQPSLPLEEALTIGGHVVRVERFLRSEEKLKDYYLESYQVTARASTDKSEGSWKTCTLRKALSVTEALKDTCKGEIQLLSFLTKNGHPNVVHLLDHYVVSRAAVGDTPRWDIFYLFAESEVRTLADLLEEHRRLGTQVAEEMALRIGTDVVDAVAFLHCSSPPLLHRDIRLGSVVETASGTFKLSGFISAAFPSAYGFPPDQLSAVYEDLECFTDRDCRSPEMTEVQCQKGVTEKSDIWCIGVLLHILCYHQHPSRGQGLSDGEPTPVSNRGNGHPAVQELLDAMLQHDPQSRPTAANLQQSLRQALDLSQPVARNDPHLNFPSSLRELLTMPRRPYCPRPTGNATPAWELIGEGQTSTHPNDENDPEDADMRSMIDWISPRPVDNDSFNGDTFEGHHRVAGRVALRRLRGDGTTKDRQLKLLERERAIWRRLRHPHILQFLGTLMREESIYLVSPLTTNGTIVKYLEAYPNANRVKLLCETADAVHYLHTQGIVHGDIRGASILIDDDNRALLRNFELSKLEATMTTPTLKHAGALRWLSPELIESDPRSFSSDVFAFGMTITEVLTGKIPFGDTGSDISALVDVLSDVRPSKIPPHSADGISYENVWEVAEACWAQKPEDRIPMSEVLKRLREDPSLLQESDSHVSFEDGITSISQEPVKTNGGFGNIFLGYHKTAGQVALKCPRLNNEDTIRRFTREARLWQDLKHQHVLPLLGMFNRGLVLYIASPFVSNGNLAEYAATSPGADRIRLLCETADALQYLHAQSFIHGDIKGSNVLIGDRCQALLCDFGLTRECDTATSIGLHGHGTVRWQSPELLEESSKSMASDAYAFGMTIAEVLTGQPPFNHIKANAAVILAVLGKHARPKQEPQVCPIDEYSYVASWAVAAACWATEPEKRISMTEAFSRLSSSREES